MKQRNEPEPGVFNWLVIMAATCLLLYLFQKILWLVIPALLALMVYYCLQPLARALMRAGLQHGTAAKVLAGILALATALAVLLALAVVASHASSWQTMTGRYVQGGLDFLRKTESWLGDKMPMLRNSAFLRSSPTNLNAMGEQFTDKYLGLALMEMAHWLPSLLLIPYLAYFFLRDGNRLKKRLIRSVPNAYFEKTLLLFERVDRSLQGFFIGLMKLTFLDTACLGLGLWLLGISFPLQLAFAAAVFSRVPYIGSAVGCVLVVLVAATDFPNQPAITYGCIVLFLLVRMLDDFIFMPMTIGRSLQIHPVLSVIMLFLGAAVAGAAGLLLVLPVMGVVAVIAGSLGQILTDARLRARFRHANQLKLRLAGLP